MPGEVTLKSWHTGRSRSSKNAADLRAPLAGLIEARKASPKLESKPSPSRPEAADSRRPGRARSAWAVIAPVNVPADRSIHLPESRQLHSHPRVAPLAHEQSLLHRP